MKSRITVVSEKNGSKRIVVQDPHTGRVVSDYKAQAKDAEGQVRAVKDILDRKGHSVEVTEH